jgi:hypothetical protein
VIETEDDIAAIQRAYRKARWTLLMHVIFVGACSIVAIALRRMFALPPALLGVAFIVALIVFGGDVMNFLRCRDRVRRLNEHSASH